MAYKSAIIFGAGSGIGNLIAGHLLARSVALTAADISTSSMNNIKQQGANVIASDITVENTINDAFESHKKRFGSYPNIVINTAGIQGPIDKLWLTDSEKFKKTVEINLNGCFLVTKQAISHMIKAGEGTVMHFSGGGSAYARPNFAAYGVSKTGVLRLVENAEAELKEAGIKGIIVNAIAPGAVKTNMTQEVLKAGDKAGTKGLEEAKTVNETGGTPPELIFKLVDFLSDPEANKGLSGRLIHVKEDYIGFSDRYSGDYPQETGKLRRIPIE